MNAFRPARIRQMEQSIIRTVTDVMDGFGDQTEVHVVHDFAIPVQIYIIADTLGVARSDFRLFREWSDAWFVGFDDAAFVTGQALVADGGMYKIS